MGIYITRFFWVLLMSYFTPLLFLYILQGIVLVFTFLLFVGILGRMEASYIPGHFGYAVIGSCVFGANLIATSIDLFTQANIYWIALAQLLCMVLFGYIGHRVQKHFGIALSCDEPMFKDVPCKSHI